MIMVQNYAMSIRYSEKRVGNKYDSIKLFLETYNYENQFENEESCDTTSRKCDKEESVGLSDMHPLEGDEEEKD